MLSCEFCKLFNNTYFLEDLQTACSQSPVRRFSFIRICFIHTHFWKEYAQRSTCFIIFGNNEIFKILFIEGKPVRYYYFINSYIIYQNRDFLLIKFVLFNFSIIKFYNFLSIFKYGFDFFYNFVNL